MEQQASSLTEAQEHYDQQTQKQRLLIDSQTREQLLSLTADFPRVWNDPSVEPRERKRILRLLVEDSPGYSSLGVAVLLVLARLSPLTSLGTSSMRSRLRCTTSGGGENSTGTMGIFAPA